MKIHSLPESLELLIRREIERLGYRLEQSDTLAQCIREVSDGFTAQTRSTPWDSKRNLAAYWCYFFPLNYLRVRGVLHRLEAENLRVEFFKNLKNVTELGSGSGAGTLALWETLGPSQTFEKWTCIETSRAAIESHQKLLMWPPLFQWLEQNSSAALQRLHLKSLGRNEETLGFFSYSLNEMNLKPEELETFSHLLFVEPSTHQANIQLLSLRDQLVERGYSAWAPCTHQDKCAIKPHWPKHWCFDRLHWQAPEWFKKIEAHLPFKNGTLTMSYLAMSRQPPPAQEASLRFVGDERIEKGKTHWLTCEDSRLRTHTWMSRQGATPDFKRGDKIVLTELRRESRDENFRILEVNTERSS